LSQNTLVTLLRACRAGDAQAVDELVSTYRPLVFRLALSFLNDAAEADDAAQEAFVSALRALPGYRGDASFTTWLYAITANVCRGRLRKRLVRQRLAQAVRALRHFGATPARQPEEQALRGEAQAAIERAIDALPEPQRLVVVLRYYHELRLGEIAQVLRVSDRTVHNRLYAAHERLRAMLRGKVDERWME
jgi:RNA polymerase sigma-70 factor (ECF subfamily)